MARDPRIDSIDWLMDLPVQAGMPEGVIAWHYTDLAGLLGIVSTNTLWAPASGLLNDTEEMNHGRGVIYDALNEASRSSMTDDQRLYVLAKLALAEEAALGALTFVLSASTDGDSLSQWRGYSSGASGYAIGLKASDPLDLLQVEDAREPEPTESQFVSIWQTVLYDAQEKQQLAGELINRLTGLAVSPSDEFWNDALVRAYAPPAYHAATSRMKHSGFRDERELRIVATAMAADRFYHFRAGPYGLTPYVKLTGVPKPIAVRRHVDFSQERVHKLPIEAIRIGPGPHVGAAEEGLRSAPFRFGYEDVQIRRSVLPFR